MASMHVPASWILCIVLAGLILPRAPAQGVPQGSELAKYQEMLRKRPRAGAVFERFYAAWLENGSADSLRDYLISKANAPDATAADHIVLALLEARQGRDADAIAAYATALKLDPANVLTWMEKSKLEARLREFPAALASLDKAVAAKPDETLAMDIEKARGRLLLRSGQSDAALKVLRGLTAAHPQDDDLAEEIIALQTEEGLLDEAGANLKALLARTKDAHQGIARRLQLADLELRQSRRDAAIALYLECLDRTGQDTWVEAEILARLETTYRREDDMEGLAKKLGELAAAQPQRIALAVAQARVVAELGNGAQAIKLFKDILARTPGRRDLQEQFLDLLEGLEKTREAIVQAEALLAQHADDRELRLRLASLQHKASDDAAAQASLEAALAAPGTVEGDHLRVARLLEQWTLKDAARAAYAKMVAAYPESIGAREAQAHFLQRAGDRDAALAIWREIAKTGAMEDVLRVGQALLACGEAHEAKDALLGRGKEFTTQARFLTLLVQAALADKDPATALPHARARLILATEASEIDEALKLARNAIEEGNQQDAVIAELESRKTPAVQERCLLASLLEGKGRAADAEKALTEAPPQDALLALSQLAQLWQNRQQWSKGAEVMEKLFGMPGGRTSAHAQKLVDLYRRAGNYPKALAFLAEWKVLSPGAVQPWLDEARMMTETGRGVDALRVLRAAVRKFDDSMEVATALATACMEAGKAEEAERIYLELYEKTQDNSTRSRLLAPLTYAAQSRGALPQLIERFTERQKLNRASAQPWLALAEIQRATGNDEERRRCLYEASRLRPKDIDLLGEIARSEEECGLWKQALRTLEAAALLDKTTKTRERIARLQLDQGDEDTGYRMLYELAGGDKMDARSLEQMADAICENGAWERAVAFMEPLLPKHPKDYRLHYLYAVALEEAGRDEDAASAFVRLMDLHQELPGVTNTGSLWQITGRGYEVPMLPEGTQDWMLLPQIRTLAYQHRSKPRGQRGSPRQVYYNNMNPNSVAALSLPMGFVTQPQNVTMLSPMALSHLMQLASGMSQEKQNALAGRLARAGMSDAALLLGLDLSSGRVLIPEELLEAHPEHQALHAAWLLTRSNRGDGTDDAGLLHHIAVMFRASYPGLAMTAAVQAWREAPEKELALLQDVLSEVARVGTADSMTFNAALGLLQIYRVPEDELPDETRPTLPADVKQQLTKLLRRSIGSGTASPANLAMWQQQQALQAMALTGMWEDFIGMVQDIMRNPAVAAPQANAGISIYSGSLSYRSGGFAFMPLPFPFKEMGVPPSLAFLMVNQYDPDNGRRFSGLGSSERLAKNLKPLIEKITEPALRFVMQYLVGDTLAVDAEVQRRVSSSSPSAGGWSLAGWVAQQRGEFREAIEDFAKAAALEPDAAKRRALECAILFHAQQVQQGMPLSQKDGSAQGIEAIHAPLKEALDRLAKSSLQPGEKMQLAQMMQSLGFDEEAKALQQNPGAAPGTVTVQPQVNPYSQRFTSSRNAGNTNAIERLAKAGNKDGAVLEALKQIRGWCAQWLMMRGQGQYEMERTMQTLQKLGLVEAVREAAKPKDGAGWKQLQEYGAFKELTKLREEARSFYEAAVAQNPRAIEARLRLISILADTDVKAAVAHLEAMPRSWVGGGQQAALALWNGQGRQQEPAVSHRMAMARVFTTWLNQLAESGRPLDPSLINSLPNMLQMLQQGESGSGLRFPNLWTPMDNQDPVDRFAVPVTWSASYSKSFAGNGKELRQALRTAHDDFCRALLRFPETALQGFRPLAGLVLAEKGDLSEMNRIATALLTQRADPRVKRRSSGYVAWSRSYARQDQIPLPLPADVMVRYSAHAGGMAAVERDVLPLVAAVEGKQEAALSRAYARLLTCEEAEFLEAAKAWTELPTQNSMWNGSNRVGQGGPAEEVVNIWNERKLTLSLEPFMFGVMKRELKSYLANGYVPDVWSVYAGALARRGDSKGMQSFMRAARDQFLGGDAGQRRKDVAEWQAAQRDDRSRRSYAAYGYGYGQQSRSKMARITNWSQWLNRWQAGPQISSVLALAEEDGFADSPEWLQQFASSQMNDRSLLDAARIIQLADALGFLAKAEDFRPRNIDAGEPGTWLEGLAQRIGEAPVAKAVREEIAKRPPTLGTELFVALLDPQLKTAFPSAVKRREADFTRVPEQHRSEVASLLRKYLPGYPDADLLGPELAEALKPILAEDLRAVDRELDKILSAKTWEEVAMNESQFSVRVPRMIQRMSSVNREKALAGVKRGLELLRSSPMEKMTGSRNSRRELPSRQFFQQLGQAAELLGPLLEMADAEGFTKDEVWCSGFAFHVSRGNDDGRPNARQLAAIFTGTPLVAEADHFRDLRLPGEGATLLLQALGPLRYSNAPADLKEAVRKTLVTQPRTFGVELVAALLNLEGPDLHEGPKSQVSGTFFSPTIADFIVRRSPDFEKLKDSAAADVLDVLRSTSRVRRASPPEEYAAALKPLYQAAARLDEAEFSAWMAADNLATLHPEPSAASRDGLRLLRAIAGRDAGDGLRLFDHQCQLFMNVDRLQPSRGSPANTQLAMFLQGASRIPEVFGPAIARADQIGLAKDSHWLREFVQSATYAAFETQDPSSVVSLLQGAGLLGDATSFRLYSFQVDDSQRQTRGEQSIPNDLVSLVEGQMRSNRGLFSGVISLLEARQPQTFGVQLVRALLNSNDAEARLITFVREHENELADMR
jgi:predicted Zn-dependent protease